MQFVFEMRYSFFGQSGWRSRASREAQILFGSQRLSKRAFFLEKVALASLAAQTDPDFHLVLLSSADLPQDHKEFLVEICNDMLGPDRAHVIFREPARAGTWFKRYLRRSLGGSPVTAQVVLDDDDAVSTDFVEVMRREAECAQSLFQNPKDYVYLSQAQGLTAVFDNQKADLFHRTVPLNTQGLILVAPTRTRRNPFFTAHKKLARTHPARVIYGNRPYYIRAVHDTNDSRAIVGKLPVKEDEMPEVLDRFPLLSSLVRDPSQPGSLRRFENEPNLRLAAG